MTPHVSWGYPNLGIRSDTCCRSSSPRSLLEIWTRRRSLRRSSLPEERTSRQSSSTKRPSCSVGPPRRTKLAKARPFQPHPRCLPRCSSRTMFYDRCWPSPGTSVSGSRWLEDDTFATSPHERLTSVSLGLARPLCPGRVLDPTGATRPQCL